VELPLGNGEATDHCIAAAKDSVRLIAVPDMPKMKGSIGTIWLQNFDNFHII
jgi:hypothetical protein